MGKDEGERIEETALLTSGRLENRDKVSLALSTGGGAEATGDLAVDDAVPQGLFRRVIGRRDVGTCQEDKQTDPMFGVPGVKALAVGIVGILAQQALEFLMNTGDLVGEMHGSDLATAFAQPHSAIQEGLELIGPATAIRSNGIL